MQIPENTSKLAQRTLTLKVGISDGNVRIDECIYCGSKGDLTDEHTIPKGLWGQNVLQGGSCKNCATLTSKFELAVLRHGLGRAREYLGAGTRHSKKKRNLERQNTS